MTEAVYRTVLRSTWTSEAQIVLINPVWFLYELTRRPGGGKAIEVVHLKFGKAFG